jgi:hypothetical protein
MDIDVTFNFSVQSDSDNPTQDEKDKLIKVAVNFIEEDVPYEFITFWNGPNIDIKTKTMTPSYKEEMITVPSTIHVSEKVSQLQFLNSLRDLTDMFTQKSIWPAGDFSINDITFTTPGTPLRTTKSVKNIVKKCKQGFRLNKTTKWCRKVCAKRTRRNTKTNRCKKDKSYR